MTAVETAPVKTPTRTEMLADVDQLIQRVTQDRDKARDQLLIYPEQIRKAQLLMSGETVDGVALTTHERQLHPTMVTNLIWEQECANRNQSLADEKLAELIGYRRELERGR